MYKDELDVGWVCRWCARHFRRSVENKKGLMVVLILSMENRSHKLARDNYNRWMTTASSSLMVALQERQITFRKSNSPRFVISVE